MYLSTHSINSKIGDLIVNYNVDGEQWVSKGISCLELKPNPGFITASNINEPSAFAENNKIEILSGHNALITTYGEVKIPIGLIGFISIKSVYKNEGLINISGFHVDPGYEGVLQFYVYNSGPKTISIDVDKPCFIIWYAELDMDTNNPYAKEGKRQLSPKNVNGIFKSINYSPASVASQQKDIEAKLENVLKETKRENYFTRNVAIFVILIGVIIPFAYMVLEKYCFQENKSDAEFRAISTQLNALKSEFKEFKDSINSLQPKVNTQITPFK